MNAKKALRKFGDACLNAPPGAWLTVGLSWVDPARGRDCYDGRAYPRSSFGRMGRGLRGGTLRSHFAENLRG